MAIESKDILEYLNLDGIEKPEDFKEKFSSTYIKRDAIKEDKELLGSLFGKGIGLARVALMRDLKKEGVEFNEDEIKEWKGNILELDDLFEKGVSKLKTHFQNQYDTLKANAGKPSEQLEKEWTEKIHKAESKANDFKSLLEKSTKEWEAKELTYQDQVKSVKLDTKKSDLFKEIKWKTGATEVEKEGFNSILNKKYKFDLDENGNLEVFNTKGERIPNPKKNGTFKVPKEIIEEEGQASKVWEVNPVAAKARPQPAMHTVHSPVLSPGLPVRQVSQAARANEGRQ